MTPPLYPSLSSSRGGFILFNFIQARCFAECYKVLIDKVATIANASLIEKPAFEQIAESVNLYRDGLTVEVLNGLHAKDNEEEFPLFQESINILFFLALKFENLQTLETLLPITALQNVQAALFEAVNKGNEELINKIFLSQRLNEIPSENAPIFKQTLQSIAIKRGYLHIDALIRKSLAPLSHLSSSKIPNTAKAAENKKKLKLEIQVLN